MTAAKVVVILGVGLGLGEALAHRFAREGFSIVLMARTLDKITLIEKTINDQGGNALSIAVNATDPESVAQAFEKTKLMSGNPEVLIYNAGIFLTGGILEINAQQFEEGWKINCFGAFLAAQQVLPGMIEQGRGTLLLSGATASLKGGARFSGLAVGKFGLRALGQSLAREFGPLGIHVAHVIIDGQMDSEKIRLFSPDRKTHTLLSLEAVADTYWYLYKQDTRAWTQEIDLRPSVEKF